MYIKTIKTLLFSFTITFLFNTASATTWPMFDVLSPQTIVTTLLVHNGCKVDEARIPAGTEVAIKSRYIPYNETWYWRYQGNSECHKLPENLEYIGFHQTDHYTGGIIETTYGSQEEPLFHFIFIIPGPYWYCGHLAGPNPPQTIACAQDQLYNFSK
jgi:hypothetical protein